MNIRILEQQSETIATAVRTIAKSVAACASDAAQSWPIPHAYLVGGCVRDALLGRESHDIDMEVYGLSSAHAEELLNALYPGRVVTVGQSFGVLKIRLASGEEIDVAIPRRERKEGEGHRGFVIDSDPSLSLVAAAARRDFTINAILFDPLTGMVENPVGGIDDLERRVLRVTDATRFIEDSLRVYRALQFAARMELTIDSASMELMKTMVARGDTNELSSERITEEIWKLLLQAERPSIGFELARELRLIERDYPELAALIGTPQEPEWHPEGDVWIHTLMAIDCAARLIRQPREALLTDEEKRETMLGILCHDLGKPSTTRTTDGRIRSLGHEAAGAEPTKSLLARWTIPSHITASVIAIVQDHLKPAMLCNSWKKGELSDEQYERAVRRLIRRLEPARPATLALVAEADFRGRAFPNREQEPYVHGEKFLDAVTRNNWSDGVEPLLKGRDLIALGIPPGPRVGEMLQTIEDARDEGKISTKEEAMEMAKRMTK